MRLLLLLLLLTSCAAPPTTGEKVAVSVGWVGLCVFAPVVAVPVGAVTFTTLLVYPQAFPPSVESGKL
jgi:hypothetical protein